MTKRLRRPKAGIKQVAEQGAHGRDEALALRFDEQAKRADDLQTERTRTATPAPLVDQQTAAWKGERQGDCLGFAGIELGVEGPVGIVLAHLAYLQPAGAPPEFCDDSRRCDDVREKRREQTQPVDTIQADEDGAVRHDKRHDAQAPPSDARPVRSRSISSRSRPNVSRSSSSSSGG